MGSPIPMSPCSKSQGKRRLDTPIDAEADAQSRLPRSHARIRSLSISPGDNDTESLSDVSTAKHHRCPRLCSPAPLNQKQGLLTREQLRLLQQWYEGFARPLVAPALPDEQIVAFATATQIESEMAMDYVRTRRKDNGTADDIMDNEQPGDDTIINSVEVIQPSSETYTLAEANKHLHPTVLSIVERYVSGRSRRRSQNDGRRSVNTGPYRCTFGCGYRTKRTFDWRRHEETHEPQELWLCTTCDQSDAYSPFLVNRKDKFLKHVADRHANLAAGTILDKSKLKFVPRAILGCLFCSVQSANWDDRCRHVLGHFEDEVEPSMKRCKVVHEEPVEHEPSEEAAPTEGCNVVTNMKDARGSAAN